MATGKKIPIDPLVGPRCILEGRIVTMNRQFRVVQSGRIYLADGLIVAVRGADAAMPAGFEAAPIIKTGGTIFPGLIELHNHLSYNALQLWQVPRIFAHRGQWSNHPDKKRLISQPMSVLASIGGTIEALVRYVEAKCLVSGVTTSQGLTLVAAPGIEHKYRGIVRNVENTDDEALPEALTRIADVASAADFAKRLKKAERASLLLHLAEGIGEAARKHFLRLQLSSGTWAISPALIGIHAAALLPQDFDVVASQGAGIVWSPLSNLLLYGGTADVKSAKAAEVPLALGSDWSPSGSKNLLSELKVARAWSERQGGIFSARELVSMVTINPARMLKWNDALGSIEVGKRADFLVIKGRAGDPYEQLLKALEDDIQLVLINGVPRFGEAKLMEAATAALVSDASTLESRKVGSRAMRFNFTQQSADPLVAPVSLQTAEERLITALRDLPELASGLIDPLFAAAHIGVVGSADGRSAPQRWTLQLENDEDTPRDTLRALAPLELRDKTGIFGGDALADNAAAAANLVSMQLDALSVADDGDYFVRLATQINLPDGFAASIARLHGATVPATPNARAVRSPPSADSPTQIEPSLPRSLSELRELPDTLTREDRREIVGRMSQVLSEIYVHLPLKRAAHAVDPIQRLKLLQYALDEGGDTGALKGMAFHQAVLEIFTELRDLHTSYILPPPYNDLTAFLPFLIERCFATDSTRDAVEPQAVFVVSKVAASLQHPTFVAGVELLYWNGMPLDNAIQQNSDRQAGSNLAARFARGLAGMTIRPLARVLPPQEEWVLLTYRALDGRVLEIRLPWQIRSSSGTIAFPLPPLSAANLRSTRRGDGRGRDRQSKAFVSLTAFGIDTQMEAVNLVRRDLYAAKRVRKRLRRTDARQGTQELSTSIPDVLRARIIEINGRQFGHLRIFTFAVPDADAFVNEVVRLIAQLPARGLILDVRNNGGGLIWAAEQLLQIFTGRRIEPERAQFLNSPTTLRLVRLNSHSTSFNLQPWAESISRAVVTGAVHSEGFPITAPERANAIGRKYRGKVVLITDALAYSATDMFVAGFRDHEIGPILGVDDNTGAGGANVWSYSLLQQVFNNEESPFKPLPGGCDVRVAARRMLRAGANAGMPLEDLGVVPDARHFLTRRDVLDQNQDLLAHAAALM
jgi:Amidohydrolase family/Peptidase family S41